MIDTTTAPGDGASTAGAGWVCKPKPKRRRKRTPDPAMPPIALRSRQRLYKQTADGHLGARYGTLDIIVAPAGQWGRMPESKREDADGWEVSRFACGWVMATRIVGADARNDRLHADGREGCVTLLRECRNRLLTVLDGEGFDLATMHLSDNGACEFSLTLPDDRQERGILVTIRAED